MEGALQVFEKASYGSGEVSGDEFDLLERTLDDLRQRPV
jgi:hypothetical protein